MTQTLCLTARSAHRCDGSRPPPHAHSSSAALDPVEDTPGNASWHGRCENHRHEVSAVVPPRTLRWGVRRRGHLMNPRHYIDLKESSRTVQPTYYFMINCLLYSRMETGLV